MQFAKTSGKRWTTCPWTGCRSRTRSSGRRSGNTARDKSCRAVSVREFRFEGYRVTANAPILLFPQATHFDPAHFREPERFDPLRFVGSTPPDPFAFIPFGRGSHMCLGMHFATMEVKAILYRLLLTWEIRVVKPGGQALNYVPIVRPVRPVRLRLRRL